MKSPSLVGGAAVVVHVPLERRHHQLVVLHADVLFDLGVGRPCRNVVLVTLVVRTAVLALAVGDRRQLGDVFVAAEHRHEVTLDLELARRRLEAAHRFAAVHDADAQPILHDDAGLCIGLAAGHFVGRERFEVRLEVGLLLRVFVGAFLLEEVHRRVVLRLVVRNVLGVLRHVRTDVGAIGIPLCHLRPDAVGAAKSAALGASTGMASGCRRRARRRPSAPCRSPTATPCRRTTRSR